MNRNNRLQCRRMPHRHLQRCESAPGNAKHAHASVRPTLVRQPIDDLLAVDLLLLGIFALRRHAFTAAETANVNAHADVSAPREIRMPGIIAGRRPIIFAIRQVFEQGGELLSRLRAVGHVEGGGKANTIFYWNPGLHQAHAVSWGRWGFAGGNFTRRNAEEENVKGTEVKHEPAKPGDDCSRQEVSRKAQVNTAHKSILRSLLTAQ